MRVVTRAQWGAEPPRSPPVPMRLPVSKVFLHHSVTPVSGDPSADWRKVQAVAFSRGFKDISYSFGVHVDGTVLAGREFAVGAHTAGHNSKSFGVVLIGDYTQQVVTDAQVDAVRELIAWLIHRGALTPGIYPTAGHRTVANTVCPGEWAMARMAAMREPWPTAPSPNPEVEPMYTPPIGPIAAVWQDDTGRVIAAASPDGDIYAFGVPWAGNVRGKAYWGDRKVARIEGRDDGAEGYMIVSTAGERYRLPDGVG